MDKLIELLEQINGKLDRLFPRQAEESNDEITANEALKYMHCKTNASLGQITKLFPSIKLRHGIYSKSALKAALSQRDQLRELRKLSKGK